MSVLDRGALEQSPLADLHAIASELSIDGYRRLRREQLIDSILARQAGETPAGEKAAEARPEGAAEAGPEGAAEAEAEEAEAGPEGAAETEPKEGGRAEPARAELSRRPRRGRRGGRSRGAAAAGSEPAEEGEEAETGEAEIVEGVVELEPSGSAFLRANPPGPSDEDVYISAAQVKRCELISGDRISGLRRPPRRSERFASLYRIDSVNGRPASELADGVRFDELPAAFPDQHLALGPDDETLRAIDSLAPIGKGSRVTIAGPARSGKTETARRLVGALSRHDGLALLLVLVGVRPEEVAEWPLEPIRATTLASPQDAHDQAVGAVVEQARRIASRGGDAVVLLDTLDGLSVGAARRALACARNIPDGGSLTVIATASEPLGGETTVIALDGARAATGTFPAIDAIASGTLRAERLVGEEGAAAIVRARAAAAQ